MAGLLSRSPAADPLPDFVRTYAGDTLWALAVFLVLALLLPKARTVTLAITAAILSYAVELSQLCHVPWIDAVRDTTPGALLLGFGFQCSDLACYSAGIVLGAAAERVAFRPCVATDSGAQMKPRVREGGRSQ